MERIDIKKELLANSYSDLSVEVIKEGA